MGTNSELGRRCLAAASSLREGHVTKIEVEAFGEIGEPVTIYAKKPTIEEKRRIRQASLDEKGRDDPFDQAVRAIVRLACDEQMDKIFTIEDLPKLRNQVDADVIEGLAHRLMNGLSYEVAKKNS